MPIAIGLISLSTFIGGGFQMVALKVGSYAFPREQSAMMSGIASGSWSLVNFILLNAIGAGVAIGSLRILPGANLISGQRWEEIFWIIALMPAAGIAIWMFLSRNQAVRAGVVALTPNPSPNGPQELGCSRVGTWVVRSSTRRCKTCLVFRRAAESLDLDAHSSQRVEARAGADSR